MYKKSIAICHETCTLNTYSIASLSGQFLTMKSDPLSEGGCQHPCDDRKTTDGVVLDEGMQRQEDEEGRQLLHGEAQMAGDGSEGRQLCHQKNCNGEKGSCVVEKDVHSDEEEMQGDTMDYGIYKWVVVFACFFQHVITGMNWGCIFSYNNVMYQHFLFLTESSYFERPVRLMKYISNFIQKA